MTDKDQSTNTRAFRFAKETNKSMDLQSSSLGRCILIEMQLRAKVVKAEKSQVCGLTQTPKSMFK